MRSIHTHPIPTQRNQTSRSVPQITEAVTRAITIANMQFEGIKQDAANHQSARQEGRLNPSSSEAEAKLLQSITALSNNMVLYSHLTLEQKQTLRELQHTYTPPTNPASKL